MPEQIAERFHVFVMSDIGRKRSVNQDSARVQVGAYSLFVVADGVGGNLPKGEIASSTAVNSLTEHFYAMPDSMPFSERLWDSIQFAQRAVVEQAFAEGVDIIGTTLVGMAVNPEGRTIIFNVGDSRLYRLRGGRLQLMTQDQVTPPPMQDDVTQLGGAPPPTFRRSTKLANYIGQPQALTPNFYDHNQIEAGDTYLICSDGIWGKLEDETLQQVVSSLEPEEAAQKLKELVYARGAGDNLTAVIVQINSPKTAKVATVEMKAVASPRGGGRSWLTIVGVLVVLAVIAGVALVASGGLTPPATATAVAAVTTVQASEVSQSAPTAEASNTADAMAASVTFTASASLAVTPTLAPPTPTPLPASATAIPATATTPPSATPVPSDTATLKPVVVATTEPSKTPVPPSATSTTKPSATPTLTATVTASPSATATNTATASLTKTATVTPSTTPSKTPTPTPTNTATVTPSNTPTATFTVTPSLTFTPSKTPTNTPTPTPTATFTPDATQTAAFFDQFVSTCANAITANPPISLRINVLDGAIIRKGPGSGFERIGGLQNGDEVAIIGQTQSLEGQNWVFICPLKSANLRPGWVKSSNGMVINGLLDVVPTKVSPPTPTPSPSPTLVPVVTLSETATPTS